jgi:hypothetical protein
MKTTRLPRFVIGSSAALLLSFLPALASAQIKRPGAHPKYSVELEPHLVVDWDDHHWDDDLLGVGLRATIPFLDNGPISSINNNMGIGFGLDWAHSNDAGCGWWWWDRKYRWAGDCSADVFLLPVVVQWNFWLTPIISVFGEAGLEIERWSVSWDDPGCPGDCDRSKTEINPVFWGGGRFLFGADSTVGGVVRIGWPYLSLGVGILI